MIEVKKGIYREDTDGAVLTVKLSKEFFEKEPIMQAIHEYTNDYTVSMHPLPENFVGVSFSKKDNIEFNEELVNLFSNRVIDYQIRRDILKDSGHIRDIIVEYAYSPIKKKVKLNASLQNKYGFIPFQFEKFDQDHVLLVNLAGDHYFLPTEVFSLFIAYKISTSSDVYKTLKSKFFTFEDSRELEYAVDLLANQIRSKQRYLQDFTSLQMIEVTNYCNLKCSYCHASTVSLEEVELKKADGLQTDILDNILDKIFQSPSKDIKVELQGGEPLANWKSTKYLIENAYARGLQFSCRNTEIILCTNLLLINNEKLNILKKYNVQSLHL